MVEKNFERYIRSIKISHQITLEMVQNGHKYMVMMKVIVSIALRMFHIPYGIYDFDV